MNRESRIPGLRRLFRLPSSTGRIARDIDDELRFHLESRVDDLVHQGLTLDQAWERAHAEFGDLAASREELAAVDQHRLIRWRVAEVMWTVVADVRYSVRQIARAPFFAATLVLVLAVGIGANAAAFTIGRAFTARPAPAIPHPEELVRLVPTARFPGTAAKGQSGKIGVLEGIPRQMSQQAFDELATHDSVFAAIAAWVVHQRMRAATSTRTATANIVSVSPGYFPALRLVMTHGVGFGSLSQRPQDPGPVAVISHAYWRRELDADSGVVGKVIRVNGVSLTVVGVAPARFNGIDYTSLGDRVDIWVPMSMTRALFPRYATASGGRYTQRDYAAFARLAPGVSPQLAAAVGSGIMQRDWADHPECCSSPGEQPPKFGLDLYSLSAYEFGADLLRNLGLLSGVGALILLIACVTATSLLLAKALGRRREIAIRLSLGAGRWRVIRQLLTESAIVAVGAMMVSLIGLALLSTAVSARYELPLDLTLDWPTIVYSMIVASATTLLFGTIPALQATGASVAGALKSGTASMDPRGLRWQSGLTIAQIALSSALVCATGAFVGAAVAGHDVHVGVPDPEHLVTAQVDQGGERPEGWDVLRDEGRRRIEALPGVLHAAWTDAFPLVGGQNPDLGPDEVMIETTVDGTVVSSAPPERTAPWVALTEPELFAAAGLPLIKGRVFAAGEHNAAVITEDFAEHEWPGQDPIGRSFPVSYWGTFVAVGVVPAVHMTIDATKPSPVVFRSSDGAGSAVPDILIVRTTVPPEQVMPSIRRVLTELNPRLGVHDLGTFAQTRDAAVAPLLDASRVAGILSILALLMAAAGVFSVIAFSVGQRTREIGIRMALGARAGSVARLFFVAGMRLTVIGIAAGVALAIAAARIVTHRVGGEGLVDYAVLAAFALTVPIVAATAIWIPARRAVRIDPVHALRAD